MNEDKMDRFMQDFAFLEVSPGRFVSGAGTFQSSDDPGGADVAFYVNDFELSDPAPWKVPERHEMVEGDDAAALLAKPGSGDEPRIDWEAFDSESFRVAFDDVQADIADGHIRKSVPVITEKGHLLGGDMLQLCGRMKGLEAPLMRYGYVRGDEGMLGATPEELLALSGDTLRTMALAGTAPVAGRDAFEKDAKEIEEHELVAQHIIQQLADLGLVTRGERESMDLGTMVHFLSRIEVRLARPRKTEALIQRLHPTPALGSFPRTMESLRKLQQYRARLKTPARFGAPFGVSHGGEFHGVVAIRFVGWKGREVFLPSGCGVIEESVFENEWRELRLKRDSVKELLGL